MRKQSPACSVFWRLTRAPNTRYNLALAQWSAGLQDAVGTLVRLSRPSPAMKVLTLAADVYEANNDTPRAVQLLRQESWPILKRLRLICNFRRFRTTTALFSTHRHAEHRTLKLPDEARLFLARAILRTEEGDFAEAMKDFETLIASIPTFPWPASPKVLPAQSNTGRRKLSRPLRGSQGPPQ